MNTLENKMLIGRGSILTGSTSQMEIQNVMANLTPVEREFLISGMSKAEQEKIFNVQS